MSKNNALPVKSIKQDFDPNMEQLHMMEIFRQMVNDCIRIGLENNCSTLKRLSKLSYHKLQMYDIMSYYKLTAISQVCGTGEAVRGNLKEPVILRVDVSKCNEILK